MKYGRSLQELAAEVVRQRAAKHDYLTSTEHVRMKVRPDEDLGLLGLFFGDMEFGMTPLAHEQIASHVDIPGKYYKRMMAEAPELLADNVNTWFQKNSTPRMIRTLDQKARAFLSKSYRPLDNDGLLEAVVPPLDALGVQIMSCEITPTRLYIKAVDPRIERDIPAGKKMGDGSHTIFDTVCPAIVIRNSEVGLGSLAVETGVWTKACTNMAVFSERSTRKYHVGPQADLGEAIYAMLSDQTRKVTDAALWGQIGDVVKGAFDRAQFDALADKISTASEDVIKEPIKVVEVVAKKWSFNEDEKNSVLIHLLTGGNLTRYGLHAAITRAAEDEDNYDYATQMERLGGEVIELERNEWEKILEAA